MILYDIALNHTSVSNILLKIINYDFHLVRVMPLLGELIKLLPNRKLLNFKVICPEYKILY